MRGACIQCAQLSLTSAETGGWSDVTGFGSFDNSTCKRVVDLLEPGDLRLGQVVIKRVSVVKLGSSAMEVAMVEVVLVSRYGRIQRSWRIW